MSGADTDAGSGRRSAHETKPAEQRVAAEAPGASTGAEASAKELAVVLIVEDEEPIAEALALIIEDAGYLPLQARHGKQGLELARARRPSLIFTDLMMPYMDGAELIAALRADAVMNSHLPPPIVLMTAAGMRRAQEAGADAVLRKPFDIAEIYTLLDRFLTPGGKLP